MDLNPSEEQQLLIEAFGALYAKESSPERVRAAEPSGHDPDLWHRLRENGVLEMAVDEASGGSGASLLDLALVAEQHGRYLGVGPAPRGPGGGPAAGPGGRSPRRRSLLAAALAGDRLDDPGPPPPA